MKQNEKNTEYYKISICIYKMLSLCTCVNRPNFESMTFFSMSFFSTYYVCNAFEAIMKKQHSRNLKGADERNARASMRKFHWIERWVRCVCVRANTLHGRVSLKSNRILFFVRFFSSSARCSFVARCFRYSISEWNGTNFMWEIRQYKRINCKIYGLAQRFWSLFCLRFCDFFFSISGFSEVRIVSSLFSIWPRFVPFRVVVNFRW